MYNFLCIYSKSNENFSLFRSFTILLLIQLAVETQVEAFTIQRIVESTLQPDLMISESNFNQKEEGFKVIDISNVKQKKNNPSPEINNTKQVKNIEEEHNKLAEKIETLKNLKETTDVKATDKIFNLTINDINIDVASSSTTKTKVETEREYEDSSIFTKSGSSSTESTSISSAPEDDSTSTSETSSSSELQVTVTDAEENTTKSSENSTQVNNSTKYSSSTGILNEVDSTQQKYETIKTEVDNDSYSMKTVNTKNETDLDISSTKIDDYSSQESGRVSTTKSVSDNLVNEASELNHVEEITTDPNSAEKEYTTLAASFALEPFVPYWRKYTEIDRKRLNSTEPVEGQVSKETLVHAESGQNSPTIFPSLEKAFSIPFKISDSNKMTNEPSSLTSELSTDVSAGPESDLVNTLQTISDLPRVDIVSSLRAGYLDYSSRSTEEPEMTTFDGKKITSGTEANVVNLSEELLTEVSSLESLDKETPVMAITTPESVTTLLGLRSTTTKPETTSKNISETHITEVARGLASQSQLVRYYCRFLLLLGISTNFSIFSIVNIVLD